MKTLGIKLIFLLGLTGSISPKTHTILHKRNTVDSIKTKDLFVENASDSEVLEVPLREYEDDNKPSKAESRRTNSDDKMHYIQYKSVIYTIL